MNKLSDYINFWILFLMVLIVPVLVVPAIPNAFNTPKTIVILLGVSLLILLNVQKLNALPVILILLMGFNLINLLYTSNIYYSRVAATLNISCLFVIFFASMEQRITALLAGISASGFIIALITWCQFFDYYPLLSFGEPGMMIMGTIGNSNYLGAYLLFPLITTAGLFFLLNGRGRMLVVAALPVLFSALLISRARASWLGLLLAFPVAAYCVHQIYGEVFTKKVRIAILLSILGLCLAWISLPDSLKFERVPFTKSFTTETLRMRIKGYWPPAFHLWKQNPLFGTGLWSYRNMVYEAQGELPGFFDVPENNNPKPRRAHNDYLEVLVDGGLVGFALCAYIVVSALGRGVRMVNGPYGQDRRIHAAIALTALSAILGTAIFFFPFRVNATLFMTCVIIGVLWNESS